MSELRGFLTTQRIFRTDRQGQGQWVRLPRGKNVSLKPDRAKYFSFLPFYHVPRPTPREIESPLCLLQAGKNEPRLGIALNTCFRIPIKKASLGQDVISLFANESFSTSSFSSPAGPR